MGALVPATESTLVKQVDRYLVSVLLLGAVPVLLLLLGLFGFVTLAEELEDVGKGQYEEADAIRVALLTLPRIAIDLLPVAVLLGGVMALGNLAQEQELTALRAVGLSQWRMAYPLALAAIVLAYLVLLAQQFLVPRFEEEAKALQAKSLVNTVLGGETTEFWTRDGTHFIRVGDVRFGMIPADVEIYDLGDRGVVQRVLQADYADVIGPGQWLLHAVEERRIVQQEVTRARHDTYEWQSFLSPDQMASLIAPMETLTLGDLYRYVGYLEESGLNAHRYRFRLWQVLSSPISLMAMCLLGLPFVLGSVRARPAGARVLFGATVGIGFYLVEQTSAQLAMLYELPVIPLAMLPDAALLVGSIVALTRVE